MFTGKPAPATISITVGYFTHVFVIILSVASYMRKRAKAQIINKFPSAPKTYIL